MYLVLLRHGQAEKIRSDMTDEERRLTDAGRRAMAAVLPRVTALLPPGGDIHIWSSPLPRASETADLLITALKQAGRKDSISEEGIRTVPELASPSIAPVVNRISEASVLRDLSGDDVLFLVGHDPQMSQLASHAAGLAIKMNKGAALCVRLSEEAGDPEGDLCWFVRGPEPARWSRLITMEEILSAAFDRVTKRFDGFMADPDDPDTVHDLRVSIRTLRSLVSFVKPFQKKRQNMRVQSALRETVIELSRIRELDVLIEEAEKVDIDLAPLTSDVMPPKKLGDLLAEKREEEKDRILATFSRRRNRARMKMLAEDMKAIRWRGTVERYGLGEADLADRFSEITESFRAEYTALDPADVEETHKVRKKAKRIRYINSCFEPLIGDDPAITAEMKRVQDRLGALCDARVNISMLEEIRQEKKISEIARWQADSLLELQRENERQIMERLSEDI